MQAHMYALKSWTIKKRGDEFYITASGQSRQHKWHGPYRNLKRATTAIARKLEWEFTRRHNRTARPWAKTASVNSMTHSAPRFGAGES